MLKKNLEQVDDKFNNEFGDYMSKYMINENQRVQAVQHLNEIDVMSDYLIRKENIDIRKI